MNEIYNEYKDKVAFLAVYVSEAHPTDGRVSENNVKAGICFLQPKTVDERNAVAKLFIQEMKFKTPLLLERKPPWRPTLSWSSFRQKGIGPVRQRASRHFVAGPWP